MSGARDAAARERGGGGGAGDGAARERGGGGGGAGDGAAREHGSLVAGRETATAAETFTAFDPRTGRPSPLRFREASAADVAAAAEAAAVAFRAVREWPPERFGRLLRGVATELERAERPLLATADGETALGTVRLRGELARTTGQLRAFAAHVESGAHLDVIVAPPRPDAEPPQPDLRRMLVALGPVAVFEASNFPFAFGVAGGDTAAALAAGCPVVVKAHEAHPATAHLCAAAVTAAVAAAGAPPGLFSLLHGRSHAVGRALVEAPEIAAVGFTGSSAGGRALLDAAARRPQPIPVYAEMGSVNPLLVTAAALAERGTAIADGLADSIALGAGQFCTSPGLVLVPHGADGDAFAARLATALDGRAVGALLTAGMRDRLVRDVAALSAREDVTLLAGDRGADGGGADGAAPGGFRFTPALLSADAEALVRDPALADEHFGPVALVLRYDGGSGAARALAALPGQLTVTLHAGAQELAEPERSGLAALQRLAVERAGRIVWNGYPTGVAVVAAMQHGGPYPAASTSLHTSVGLTAIRRFQRPVVFQDAPAALLPPALRNAATNYTNLTIGGLDTAIRQRGE
ncbi:aldehyde dehydrogenase family protein [Conexibacter woesei]|uniref:Aldehyde Dehydrogenase n=1 Tax=Conexibacter woesei (strain DSM 14684 / CCUG 47730 / CIP 108061 / JCM 11494 / NBRC 100937 / ID131577) TaxID=469383 RepID=D3F3K4_CONWI|nr:aldehyde dehydrogenase family protein [Conexibacter woesei]ADB52369.1 Aldehyde Dehydrogenase [Conexibacter woesei DSM 14684]